MVELYFHFSIRLHGVVLNELRTGTILTFFTLIIVVVLAEEEEEEPRQYLVREKFNCQNSD
jgi:hypothetical protein